MVPGAKQQTAVLGQQTRKHIQDVSGAVIDLVQNRVVAADLQILQQHNQPVHGPHGNGGSPVRGSQGVEHGRIFLGRRG